MHIENKDIEWLEEKDGKAYLKKVEIAEYTRKYTSKQKALLEIRGLFHKDKWFNSSGSFNNSNFI